MKTKEGGREREREREGERERGRERGWVGGNKLKKENISRQ